MRGEEEVSWAKEDRSLGENVKCEIVTIKDEIKENVWGMRENKKTRDQQREDREMGDKSERVLKYG